MSLNLAAGIDFPSQLPTATAPYFLLGLSSTGAWVIRETTGRRAGPFLPDKLPSGSRAESLDGNFTFVHCPEGLELEALQLGWAANMRLDISGQFVVNVVTPTGGWSKGRPIAFIEDGNTWRIVDLLIPNDLSDGMLEAFIAHKFSGFIVAGKPIRRLDETSVNALRGRVHRSPH